MTGERELTGLLHRADWTRLALSGTVRGAGPVVDTTFTSSIPPPWMPRWGRVPEPPPPPPWFFAPEEGEGTERSLTVAPGRRFLVRSADGSKVLGSDGERVWQWLSDLPPDVSVEFDARPRPPFRQLLVPSWLLSEYSLVLDGEVTVCGRPGVRVLGTPRAVASRANWAGGRLGGMSGGRGLFVPAPRWLTGGDYDEVEAVVDAELGILLRCSRRSGDRLPSVTEFRTLEFGSAGEPSAFSAPAGSVFGGGGSSRAHGSRERSAGAAAGGSLGDALGKALGEALGAAGKEAAKTVAGMAAGGLGAMIKYGPARRTDPFARATEEAADPDAAMPADEPDPDGPSARADLSAVPDEVLHLVYLSGLTAPRFAATLHEWADLSGLLAAVPESARGTGFGGVGFLVDTIRDRAREDEAGGDHSVSTVRMGGWGEYLVDLAQPPATPERDRRARAKYVAQTIASDGVRQWEVFADRVETASAVPAPPDLTDLVDAAWLLDCDLSGGAAVIAGGRPGYRIVARQRENTSSVLGWWERLWFPAVAIVDAETGRLLRLTRFKGGLPVLRQEFRDVAELDGPADFGFTPPAGLPVEDREAERAERRSEPSWSWPPGAPRFR